MSWIFYILCFYWLPFVGMFKLFEKANQPSYAAFIPFYNAFVVTKIVGAPKWWLGFMLLPIFHFFIIVWMLVEMNKSFGKYLFLDNFWAIVFPTPYFFYLGRKKPEYLHRSWAVHNNIKKNFREAQKNEDKSALRKLEKENPFPRKTVIREWSESIIFAVFAAHFIRMFLIEAYTIPTPSMEGSLLVGDFLFVSKVHYGSRMPMTPLAFPLIHNMLPFTGGESYSKMIKWGYNRAPRIQNVERNDPVVFNYPEDDTSYGGVDENGLMVDYSIQYHNLLKRVPPHLREAERQKLLINGADKLVFRPVDKRTHYIKRCVGIPGDKIEVKNGLLFVNGAQSEEIKGVQYLYRIFATADLNVTELEDKFAMAFEHKRTPNGAIVIDKTEASMSPTVAKALVEEYSIIQKVERILNAKNIPNQRGGVTFPYNFARYPWNIDYYGPIKIPAKGTEIALTLENIELYLRLITAYEGNKLEIKNGKIFINDKETTSYTPFMDYYWMMGDNRNNSADSRSWGFVPEDHVVGKPLFVWLSLKNGSLTGPNGGVRWERLFMGASGR